MSTDSALKSALCTLLESHGFSVTPIPERSTPTADLYVADGAESYVIEIKSRDTIEAPSDPTEVMVDTIGRTNKTSGIITSAVNQIANSGYPEALRLIWVVAQEPDRELRYSQFESTAYGRMIAAGPGILKPCYYATHAQFYRHRTGLDGIALGAFSALLLNDQSLRCNRLRNSAFAQLFGTQIRDPSELESKSEAFVVRGDGVDRTSKQSVMTWLSATYGVEVNDLTQLSRFAI